MISRSARRRTVVLATVAVCLLAGAAGIWAYRAQQPNAIASIAPIEQSERLVREHSPVLGARDAQITIVEFFDPACEACRRFHPVLKGVLDGADDVRLVIRYVIGHGSGSKAAIRVLEAARLQGVFPEVLAALLERQTSWAGEGVENEQRALMIAEGAGLDVKLARSQIEVASIEAHLDQDRRDASAIGVRGTPTIFVNGRPLPSLEASALKGLIANERDSGKR